MEIREETFGHYGARFTRTKAGFLDGQDGEAILKAAKVDYVAWQCPYCHCLNLQPKDKQTCVDACAGCEAI